MIKVYRYVLCLLLLGFGQYLHAQKSALERHQDTLINIAAQVSAATDDEVKIAANADFVKQLVNALKISHSYNFGFDSLKNISVVKSPDNAFRMLTWYITLNNGTYRYYGTIQLPSPDGKLKLIPLQDETGTIKDTNALTNHRNWYGARYYDIVPVPVAGKAPFYVLLGWKGVNSKISSKLVEILSIEQTTATFGKPVFDGLKVPKPVNRYILAYNRFNTMLLQRDKTVNLIVMDHLTAIDPSKKGNPEFYASDSSFDAFKILNGRLKLLENIELRNPPDAADEFYNDPKALSPGKLNN